MASPVVLHVGRIMDFVQRFGSGLSESGLYVPSRTPLGVGAEVDLSVVSGTAGQEILFEAHARVSRRDSAGFQLTFIRMSPSSRALIELACAARAILAFASAASKSRPAGVADSVWVGDDADASTVEHDTDKQLLPDGLDEDTTGRQILPPDLEGDTGKLELPADLDMLADALEPEEPPERTNTTTGESPSAMAPESPVPPHPAPVAPRAPEPPTSTPVAATPVPAAPVAAPPRRTTRPLPAPPPSEFFAPRAPESAPKPAVPPPGGPHPAADLGSPHAPADAPPPPPPAPSVAPPPPTAQAVAPPAPSAAPAPSPTAVARALPTPPAPMPAVEPEVERPRAGAPKGALVLGIDLGTTFSCAAVVREGQTIVIPAQTGDRTFPSVVSVTADGELVGWPAYSRLATHAKDTIYGSKRLLGRAFDSQPVQDALRLFDYEVLPGEDGSAAVRLAGSIYSLTWVAARILEEIHSAAVKHLGEPISWAVITVPAYYGDRQRQAVVQAAAEAGLQVLQIVNEPTAAAIAYGIDRGLNQKVMVYDFGGGTFDVSILHIEGNVIEVIASGGDSYLGGVDLDNRIVDWAVAELAREHQIDISSDKISKMRIRQAGEIAKRELSQQAEVRLHVPFVAIKHETMVSLDVTLTRETLNRLIMDLVDRTIETCRKTLESAKLTKDDIAEILFVGGQSRTPLVQGKVHAFMGKQPRKGVHPDEAVAIGAALLAHSRDKIDSVTLLDVLSHSIGIGVPGGAFQPVIPKNVRLPAEGEVTQATAQDGQSALAIDVYQGEHPTVDGNDFLGSVRLTGLPSRPKGELVVRVHFALDAQGFLQVTCSDNVSQKTRVTRLVTRDRPESLTEAIAARDAAAQAKPEEKDGKKPGLFSRILGR